MKRRFRQKQERLPPEDPDKESASSGDDAIENVDIEEILGEIDTLLEESEDKPQKK